MGLQHDFFLVRAADHAPAEYGRFIRSAGGIHVHDDVLRYIGDTLKWIPTLTTRDAGPIAIVPTLPFGVAGAMLVSSGVVLFCGRPLPPIVYAGLFLMLLVGGLLAISAATRRQR